MDTQLSDIDPNRAALNPKRLGPPIRSTRTPGAGSPQGRRRACFRPWQQERTTLLRRVCRLVGRRVASGVAVRRAVRVAARRYRRRCYGDGRPVRFSASMLTRSFYEFRRTGPEAFRLGYRGPRGSTVPPAVLDAFRLQVTAPGVTSLMAAYRRLVDQWRATNQGGAAFPYSYQRLTRGLGPAQRAAAAEYHRIERLGQKARRQFSELTK